MSNHHWQNRKRRCQCHHCRQRAYYSQLVNEAIDISSSSESSSPVPTRDRNLWTPGSLGTGAGTDSWRARQHEDCSSDEIIDNTTFTRRCWRPPAPKPESSSSSSHRKKSESSSSSSSSRRRHKRPRPRPKSESSSSSSSSRRRPRPPKPRPRRRLRRESTS